ncbi:MAG TPA: hypothetical protein VF257_10760 [Solirubrobacteraceae bacterium]
MAHVAEVVALVTAVMNLVAAALGAWRWWTVEPSRAFWVLCRAGQALGVVQALVAGMLAALGFHPADGLYWLYALLPVAVSFVGEQLRVTAAEAILDDRDLEDAQAVGKLDEAGQRSVVLAIVRREMGTMAAAALVVAFLALRAWGTA